MFCNKCGAKIEVGNKFCTACGNPVSVMENKPLEQIPIKEPVHTPPAMDMSYQKPKKKTGLIIGLVVGAVFIVAAGVGAFFIFSGGGYSGSTQISGIEVTNDSSDLNSSQEEETVSPEDFKGLIEAFFNNWDENFRLSGQLGYFTYGGSKVVTKNMSDSEISGIIIWYIRTSGANRVSKDEVDRYLRNVYGIVSGDKVYSYGSTEKNYDGTEMLIYNNGYYEDNLKASGEGGAIHEIRKISISGNDATVIIDAYGYYEYEDYEMGGAKPEPVGAWELECVYDPGSDFGFHITSYKELVDESQDKQISVQNVLPGMGSVANIIASSSLSENGMTHSPDRLMDDSVLNAWVEGVSGQGIGEYVIVQFNGEKMVNGIYINAGYQKNSDLYYKNSRPKDITVVFGDGSQTSFTLEDSQFAQELRFDKSIVTDSVKIIIDSVYPGNKYEDTVISEISFF